MQSEADMAFSYANHVVNGNKQQKKLPLEDEAWFTCSEHSDESENATDIDESDRTDNDDDEMKHNTSSRHKGNFRPRFQRQGSIASASSADEKKKKTASSRKSPRKGKGDSPSSQRDRERTSSGVAKTNILVRNEPDPDERRTLRRLALARIKSEEMWGSPLESDSDEAQIQTKQTTSKKYRKKIYDEYGGNETDIKDSSSPMKAIQAALSGGSENEASRKKYHATKPRELLEAAGPRNTACRGRSISPSKTKHSKVSDRHDSNPETSNGVINTLLRSRSASPSKSKHSKVSDRHDSKPNAHAIYTDKKHHKYEMIPTGSIRQNRSSVNKNVPIQKYDHTNQKISKSTCKKILPTASPCLQKKMEVSEMDVMRCSKQSIVPVEKKATTQRPVELRGHPTRDCETVSNHSVISDPTQRTNRTSPSKGRSLRSQSTFTEEKKTPNNLNDALLCLFGNELCEEFDTYSMMPSCEKPRNATTPIPNRENSSHTSKTSLSTTLRSPTSIESSSSGSCPSYKNIVTVKKKSRTSHASSQQNEKKNSEVVRVRNVEIQHRTNKYLAAVNAAGSKAAKPKSNW